MLTEKENSLIREISTDNLMGHVKYISQFDRESGSKGEWLAADYFKTYMESLGLPTKVYTIDNLISLPIKGNLFWQDQSIPCITHSYGASTPADGVTGEGVYLDKPFDGSNDIKGKIVISYGLASPVACYQLERQGALGLIFINNSDHEHNMSISPIWGMPLPEDFDELCRIPVISVTRQIGEDLINKIKADKQLTLYCEVDTTLKKVPLCVADLLANKDSKKYLLFNGHIDSWHKGATDNGTSNAAILEIARLLNLHKNDLHYNVRFVWWSGHSNGRYSGSNWYADYNWSDIHENALVNINIDAIGSQGSTSYPRIDSSSQCYAIGFKAVNDITGQEAAYSRIARNGDQSFWGHGVPSLFQCLSMQPLEKESGDTFVPGLPWFWHTTEDLFQYVSPEILSQDTKIYFLAIWRLACSNVFPYNFVDFGEEITQDLREYQKMSESIDIDFLLDQVKELNGYFANLTKAIEVANSKEYEEVNCKYLLSLAMKVNQLLMPVYYCQSSPFEVDDALPKKPFPGLQAMAKIENEKDEIMKEALIRKCQRSFNRIAYALEQCINVLSQAVLN